MANNVVKLNRKLYRKPRSPNKVLRDNIGTGLTEVLVIGVDEDGQTIVGGSPPDPGKRAMADGDGAEETATDKVICELSPIGRGI